MVSARKHLEMDCQHKKVWEGESWPKYANFLNFLTNYSELIFFLILKSHFLFVQKMRIDELITGTSNYFYTKILIDPYQSLKFLFVVYFGETTIFWSI